MVSFNPGGPGAYGGGGYAPNTAMGAYRNYLNGISGEATSIFHSSMQLTGKGKQQPQESGGLLSKIPIVGGLFGAVGSVVKKIPIVGDLLGGLF